MGFSNDNVKTHTVVIPDLGAAEKVLLFRAPQSVTVKGVTFYSPNAGTATGNTWAVQNWGTAGTAIKAGAAGTVCAPVAGTAVTANAPLRPTVVSGSRRIAAGEHLVVDYTKGAGDAFPEKAVTVQIDYVDGLG